MTGRTEFSSTEFSGLVTRNLAGLVNLSASERHMGVRFPPRRPDALFIFTLSWSAYERLPGVDRK